MDMISILIPVYKESNLFEKLLNQLIKDPYENKEIISVIDEPTENSLELVEKYKNQVKFILNKKRKGKVNALNEAAKTAKGDILLFVDSDCIISKSKDFLRRIKEKMKNADLLDIKKNVIKSGSFLSKMINYEYLNSDITCTIFDKINACLGVCGQNFAIKRKFFEEVGGFKNVIAEDLEIGIQTYLKRKKYNYLRDVEIHSKAPLSWSSFLKQRKRWGLGAGFHVKKYWKPILKECFKHPTSFLVCMYYIWPTLFSLVSVFFIDSFLGKFLMLSLISLSLKFTFLMPFTLIVSLETLFFRNILIFIITYVTSAILFFIAARKHEYRFKNLDFALYYIIYSPINLIFYNYYFYKALFSSGKFTLDDWKI